MIKRSDGKIGTRELFALITLTVGVKLTDMTSTILYNNGKNATWMLPILSLLVVSPSCWLLFKLLKHYQNKGLMDIVYHLTGKYVGLVIGFVLFVMALAATVLNTRSYVDIMGSMFYPNTPTYFLYALFILTSYFIANRGMEAIGRTAWVTFPYIKGALLILVVLVWKETSWANIYPLLGPGPLEIVKQSVINSTVLGEVLFVALLFPFVRTYPKFKKAVIIGIVISVVELTFFFALYIALFGIPPIELLAFPFQQMTRMVTVGRFFTNLEAVFLAFWVVASVIRYAIYLYVTTALFAYMLRLKEFEPLLLPISAVVFLLGMIPENPTVTVLVIRDNILINYGWIVVIGLPMLLWLMAKWKGEFAK